MNSVFLAPAWVSTWLEVYGAELEPELLFFFDGTRAVGACFLVRRQRNLVRTLHLNCDGEDEADSTYIEYNALVALPAHEEAVADALAAHVQGGAWDRLMISGAVPQAALTRLAERLGTVEQDARPCYYVDLGRLRREGTPYARALSANTRKQNSWTRRQLEAAFGECRLERAETQAEAETYLAELGELHNAAWQARDRPGMFASRRFLAFHRKFIARLFPAGEILLLRLKSGAKVIAVLYCFVYLRRVYFYQSGIFYGEDKRLRPGFLALTLAIEHLQAREDVDEFDFLAGDAQYKKSLGTGCRELRWTTVWAPSISSSAFRALKFIKEAIGPQGG